MTPELFAKLKDVKSSKGYTLSNAMQAGTFHRNKLFLRRRVVGPNQI